MASSVSSADPRGAATLSLTIVVPDDLTRFEAMLDAARIAELTRVGWRAGALDGCKVDLTMPRFSIDTSARLADALKAMGMPTAFDPAVADLTAMANPARTGEHRSSSPA